MQLRHRRVRRVARDLRRCDGAAAAAQSSSHTKACEFQRRQYFESRVEFLSEREKKYPRSLSTFHGLFRYWETISSSVSEERHWSHVRVRLSSLDRHSARRHASPLSARTQGPRPQRHSIAFRCRLVSTVRFQSDLVLRSRVSSRATGHARIIGAIHRHRLDKQSTTH